MKHILNFAQGSQFINVIVVAECNVAEIYKELPIIRLSTISNKLVKGKSMFKLVSNFPYSNGV